MSHQSSDLADEVIRRDCLQHIDNKIGFSHGYNNVEAAERMAVSECLKVTGGTRDCKPEVGFFNSCGAIASGDDDIISLGTNELRVSAALADAETRLD